MEGQEVGADRSPVGWQRWGYLAAAWGLVYPPLSVLISKWMYQAGILGATPYFYMYIVDLIFWPYSEYFRFFMSEESIYYVLPIAAIFNAAFWFLIAFLIHKALRSNVLYAGLIVLLLFVSIYPMFWIIVDIRNLI